MDQKSGIEFKRVGLDAAVAQELIGELNAELSEAYPEEGANFFRLDPDEVAPGHGAFLVAYQGEQALACGAVRRLDAATAEIKRMFVRRQARGLGLGRQVLEQLEQEALRLGSRRIVLETGKRQAAALALYERCGYHAIPAFGDYVGAELSLCMAKEL